MIWYIIRTINKNKWTMKLYHIFWLFFLDLDLLVDSSFLIYSSRNFLSSCIMIMLRSSELDDGCGFGGG